MTQKEKILEDLVFKKTDKPYKYISPELPKQIWKKAKGFPIRITQKEKETVLKALQDAIDWNISILEAYECKIAKAKIKAYKKLLKKHKEHKEPEKYTLISIDDI